MFFLCVIIVYEAGDPYIPKDKEDEKIPRKQRFDNYIKDVLQKRGGTLMKFVKLEAFYLRFGPNGSVFRDVKIEDNANARQSGGNDTVIKGA